MFAALMMQLRSVVSSAYAKKKSVTGTVAMQLRSVASSAQNVFILQCQKKRTTVSKETYYSVKRDLQQKNFESHICFELAARAHSHTHAHTRTRAHTLTHAARTYTHTL